MKTRLAKELKNPHLIDRQELKEEIPEFTSDTDLEKYFGKRWRNTRVHTYADLDKFQSIDKLLPKKKDFSILLVENSPNSGHWVALLKYGDTVEFFNSYGASPGYEVRQISSHENKMLDQSPKDITGLLDTALSQGKKVIYNKKKFQKMAGDVNTCGKHTILRCIMLKDYNMNLEEYQDYIERMKKKYKMDYDHLVSLLIEV